jgi:hypothetical protein
MKNILVIRDNMTDRQAQEAQLFGMKHERTVKHVDIHTWTGSLGNYTVTNLKKITVRLAK